MFKAKLATWLFNAKLAIFVYMLIQKHHHVCFFLFILFEIMCLYVYLLFTHICWYELGIEEIDGDRRKSRKIDEIQRISTQIGENLLF